MKDFNELTYEKLKEKALESLDLKLYKDAIIYLQKYLSIKTEDSIIELLGDCYLGLFDFDKALSFYNQLIKSNTRGEIYNKIASIYFQKNDFIRAKKFFFLAIKKNVKDPKSIYKLAYIAFVNNAIGEAIQYYEMVLELLKGKNADILGKVHFNLGELYILREKYEIASEHFEQIKSTQLLIDDIYIKKAYCYYKLNDLEKSRQVLEEGIDKFPDNLSIRYNLGKLEIQLNNVDFGIKLWREYLHHIEKNKNAVKDEKYQKIAKFFKEYKL